MPTFARNLILVVLAVGLLFNNVGCLAVAGSGGDAGTLTTCADGCQSAGELQQINHGGGRALVYVGAGFLIATVAVVDLLLLPFTYRRPFPCCRGVLRLCH